MAKEKEFFDLITLRNHAPQFFLNNNNKKNGRFYGPRPFSVSLFRSQTIFGLGDAQPRSQGLSSYRPWGR